MESSKDEKEIQIDPNVEKEPIQEVGEGDVL